MQIRNSSARWGIVQQSLHWLVALLVLSQLVLGFIVAGRGMDARHESSAFAWHASIGTLVLVLMIARFVWRQRNPLPTTPKTLNQRAKRVAKTTHLMWYGLLLLMPLSGLLLALSHPNGVPLFGIDLPGVLANSGLNVPLWYAHLLGVATVLGLLSLHITAAVRHEAVEKDDTLRRMIPGAPQPVERHARTQGTTQAPAA